MSDSEEYLLQEYQRTQQFLAEAKNELARVRINVNEAEQEAAEAEADLVEYMKKNGLLKFETGLQEFSLSDYYSVDISSPEAVPDEYMREKTLREPDKVKIRGERPQGNWYTMQVTQRIRVRAKKP